MSSNNFKINTAGPVSMAFLEQGLDTFDLACEFISALPFRRNSDKNDELIIFKEKCGTCGTKHALLKTLCSENGITDVQLKLVLLKLSGKNMPALKEFLEEHRLDYLPEAHNYLLLKGEIIDCTGGNFSVQRFKEHEILSEIDIEPSQITNFKVAYHKAQLATWLANHPKLKINSEELWKIRESCIHLISGN